MTNFTTKLMIAAAAMAVAAAAASAQTMKADVPFSYQARGKTMAAGTYWVTPNSNGIILLQSKDGHNSVLAMSASRIESDKPGNAKLVFSCRRGNCTLVEVWPGITNGAYSFPLPKDRDYEAALVVVALHRNSD